jgi:hypothetical protein
VTDRIPLSDLTSDDLDQLYDRAEGAEAARNRLLRSRDRQATRAEQAEAAIERVRELHQRWDADPSSCAHCVDGYGTPLHYPCPTARSLDPQEQPGL